MYLAIAGNIGVGKSTLTHLVAERYLLTPIYEAVNDNPYLEDFYQDMPRYAFHSQIFFLSQRLEQHLKFINPGQRIVQDRTIFEDATIFAKNLHAQGIMNLRDYQTYHKTYEAILKTLRAPDVMVYLQASVATLQQRISQRGRRYERQIPADYLESLNHLYDAWIKDYALKKVIIPCDEVDFVNSKNDLAQVFDILESSGLTRPVL
jgi:deoxyadenosine/deoxycytidine kinase